jgi:triacylglycerol lipase
VGSQGGTRVLIRSALAALALTLATATAAQAAPPYPVSYTFDGALTAQGAAPNSAPPGANDFSCRPNAAHPNPVVLVHGLLANQTVNFNTLSPLIANDGYCVFSLTYGTKDGVTTPIYQPGGLANMEDSAEVLSDFIDQVLAATGADKVDIVGHSEGSLMPNHYVRFLEGADKVDRYVGLTTLWDGTQLGGLSYVAAVGDPLGLTPAVYAAIAPVCESCPQFLQGSDFMQQMNAGGVADPAVTYTNIVTQYDELVIPYTSGLMQPGPNVTNHVVQDHCATDLSEHLTVAFDPVATTLILNALAPDRARPVPCTVVLPGIGAPGYPAPAPMDSDGDGSPDFSDPSPVGAGAGSATPATVPATAKRKCAKRKRGGKAGKEKRRCGKRKGKRRLAVAAAPGPTDLTLAKSDSADPVTVGDSFNYTIQVQNPGANDATDVVVTDTLPSQVDHLSTTTNPASATCQRQGVTVTCDFGTLNAGSAGTVTIRVRADDAGTASNQATVSTTVIDGDAANNSDTETTVINAKPKTTKQKKTKKPKGPRGRSCGNPTISGTPGDDTGSKAIVGTPGDDVIRAFEGDDTIFGGGGADLICADFGTDFIGGGPGADTIIGGVGRDKLSGDSGGDLLKGKGGRDVLRGRRGPDLVNGGRGRDNCGGGPGRDRMAHCP